MSTGIRDYVNARFAEYLPEFQAGEMDGTMFRRTVMNGAVETFEISVQSAATHYNYSLKQQRMVDEESVKNLGRPDDKKGGRPVIHPVTLIKAKNGEVVMANISRTEAQTYIATAVAKGKEKLAIKEDVEAAAEVVVPAETVA